MYRVVDVGKKLIALLAGHPDNLTYMATIQTCVSAIAKAQEKLQFLK